jgi:hypothetical protein
MCDRFLRGEQFHHDDEGQTVADFFFFAREV